MKVVVYHGAYGCETGCLGHWVELEDGRSAFSFFGPDTDEDLRKYAENLVRSEFGEEHVKDLDWENCEIVRD